ncbi:Protein of unknown function [Pyronema omphalodes CBS 100304]|uniref:Uncharacterized protein n=1 Tax=Pyronema omphalodes (strain CBS 100304) TaxID=1076935 RepID=U4KY87_PYROM|nr:Protein of unknown function [Pyronema omphalodes CBS 100304]
MVALIQSGFSGGESSLSKTHVGEIFACWGVYSYFGWPSSENENELGPMAKSQGRFLTATGFC